MTHLAVTVIGPDRPGIIADVTGALAGAGVNLERLDDDVLRGHFAMMLICSGPSLDEVETGPLASLRGELVVDGSRGRPGSAARGAAVPRTC